MTAMKAKADYEDVRSYRCMECGSIRFVNREDLPRGGVRCKECFGNMAETCSSMKRRNAPPKRARSAKRQNHYDKEERAAKPFKCPECGQRFRNRGAMAIHMEEHERKDDDS